MQKYNIKIETIYLFSTTVEANDLAHAKYTANKLVQESESSSYEITTEIEITKAK